MIPAAAPSVQGSNIPIRNLWYMLLYAWNELKLRGRWAAEIELAPSLDALLAMVLTNLMHERLRVGLGRDYCQHEALIRGVRGRVDFAKSLRRLAFQHGQASCRFETYSPNVPKNQIVRSTLARLAQVGEFGPDTVQSKELRHRVRALVRGLDTIDLIELTPEFIRRHRLRRQDADYRVMLEICELLAQGQMPSEIGGQTAMPRLDRESMVLHRVFEKFIANFYLMHLKGWNLTPQANLLWPVADPPPYLPRLIPDLVLRHDTSGSVIVLDTKFTAKVLTAGRWDKLIFSQDHLFQIYAYLRSQEQESSGHQTATGILLYPTVNHRLSETMELQGHKIRWETIDLQLPWREIEKNLIALVRDPDVATITT